MLRMITTTRSYSNGNHLQDPASASDSATATRGGWAGPSSVGSPKSSASAAGLGRFKVLLFVQKESAAAHRALWLCQQFLRQPGDTVVLAHVNTVSEASGRRLMEALDVGAAAAAPSLPHLRASTACHTEYNEFSLRTEQGSDDQPRESPAEDSRNSPWLRKVLIPVAQEGLLVTMIREIRAIGPDMVAIAETCEEQLMTAGPRSFIRCEVLCPQELRPSCRFGDTHTIDSCTFDWKSLWNSSPSTV